MRTSLGWWSLAAVAVLASGSVWADQQPAPLSVGWASVEVTPPKPAPLIGQYSRRIARTTRDPITATALALETRSPNAEKEQALMVSCDVLWVQKAIQERIRQRVKPLVPDLDVGKLFLNATHTHEAPGFVDDTFPRGGPFQGVLDVAGQEGVMSAAQYGDFFVERVAQAAVRAWNDRKPGAMSWGLGHAVVGKNRRIRYLDGPTVMHGNPRAENFDGFEGYEDHGVGMLFFSSAEGKLTGIVLNVACPSQVDGGISEVSADYWHDVREFLRSKLSQDLFVFPQCGAAGDIDPILMPGEFRSQAEEAMQARKGLTRRQELARRIGRAVEDVLPTAKAAAKTALVFRHEVARVDLPAHQPPTPDPGYRLDPIQAIELHAIRLGEVALATNPFELYVDYGVRIQARSPALLTLVVQLSCQGCGYLPTERAIRGGGYSAERFLVGPKGGQVLVNQTLQRIEALWR